MKNNEECQHTPSTTCLIEEPQLCISIVPIFNHLDPFEMSEIVKESHSVSLDRGQTIYQAGEKSDGLYIVHKGRVKIYRLSDNGKEQLVRILEPGDFTGELALFNESIHDAYAEALEPVQICIIGRDDFQQFLLKYPAIALKVLTEFSTRLAKTEKQAASIAMESTETRISMYLVDLVEEQKRNDVTLPMSRKDLASLLGTTPETISRKLKEFEQSGWIKQSGQREILIVDLNSLVEA